MADIICKTCGKKYKYCASCPSDMDKPSWYSLFCGEDCKNTFNVLTKYFLKKVTKEEAKEMLLKLDLSNRKNFDEDMQKQIVEIFDEVEEVAVTEDIKIVESVEPVKEIIEEKVVEQEEVAIEEPSSILPKMTYPSKKSKYKK